MPKKKEKVSPEAEVARFWDQRDATEVLDLSPKKRVELIYEPEVRSISLRLPVPLLSRIKRISAKMDVAYQNLIKVWLAERARQESGK